MRIILLLILSALLASCATVKKDGPPPYPVDVSKIKNAKPKIEPLSKRGNKSYTVFGKTYRVLKERRNYVDRGIASWYGTQFDHRKTSSGETYNMLGMTAAHRFLPLPTYVQVTNLQNQKKVIVKVNDRGPFAENRIIDLSYVAAKKLGMLAKGTAYVEVRAINPKAPCFHCHKGKRYLMLGHFYQKAPADRLKMRLSHLLITHVMVKSSYKHSRRYYQVRIGPIKDRFMEDRIKNELKRKGIVT